MRFIMATGAILLAMGAPASAEIVQFRATGVVTGFEYNPAGAAAIFAVAPIGTQYTLDFSYDTAAKPSFGSATYGSYPGAASGTFTLAGYEAALPTLNVTVGDIGMGMGDTFGLFGNAAFGPARLAGYQLIDLSLQLTDPTSAALASGALPATFNLGAFPNRSVRARFAFGGAGDTALQLSVTSLSPLASAVPEPATWAMLIVGFGLVGAASRRRAAPAR